MNILHVLSANQITERIFRLGCRCQALFLILSHLRFRIRRTESDEDSVYQILLSESPGPVLEEKKYSVPGGINRWSCPANPA